MEIWGPQRAETHLKLGDKRTVCFLNRSFRFYPRKSWPRQCFDQNSSGDKGPLKTLKTFLPSLPCPFFLPLQQQMRKVASWTLCTTLKKPFPKPIGTQFPRQLLIDAARLTTAHALCQLCRNGSVLRHLSIWLVWTLKSTRRRKSHLYGWQISKCVLQLHRALLLKDTQAT